MSGRFTYMHTLNLDFCTSLSSMEKDCFTDMPNLVRLSMCATRESNLWTTVAALSKLPSLLELRFQNCLCCKDTSPCHMKDENTTKASGITPIEVRTLIVHLIIILSPFQIKCPPFLFQFVPHGMSTSKNINQVLFYTLDHKTTLHIHS